MTLRAYVIYLLLHMVHDMQYCHGDAATSCARLNAEKFVSRRCTYSDLSDVMKQKESPRSISFRMNPYRR